MEPKFQTNNERRLIAALQRIQEKSAPGQEIDIHKAIDLLTEIYVDANDALKASVPNTAG